MIVVRTALAVSAFLAAVGTAHELPSAQRDAFGATREARLEFTPRSDALSIPAWGGTFRWVCDAAVVARPDGRVRVTGVVACEDAPGTRLAVDLSIEHDGERALVRDGQLVGLADLRGAVLDVVGRRPFRWTDGQASAPLRLRAVSDPAGAAPLPAESLVATLALSCRPDRAPRARAAQADPSVGGIDGGHALSLLGLATDFAFVDAGRLEEAADGTARLHGVVASRERPHLAFAVDARFGGRVVPGTPAHPPAGSPKLELGRSAYADLGGPVAPGAWHYYTTLEGELVGLRALAGARLSLTRRGPAFQVGVGASGKNLRPGASGWIDAVVAAEPFSGEPLPDSLAGDFNVDLFGD